MSKLYRRNWNSETQCHCSRYVQGQLVACYKPATHVVRYLHIEKAVQICGIHAGAIKRTGSWDGARASEFVVVEPIAQAVQA